jgi:hypothetical protein
MPPDELTSAVSLYEYLGDRASSLEQANAAWQVTPAEAQALRSFYSRLLLESGEGAVVISSHPDSVTVKSIGVVSAAQLRKIEASFLAARALYLRDFRERGQRNQGRGPRRRRETRSRSVRTGPRCARAPASLGDDDSPEPPLEALSPQKVER